MFWSNLPYNIRGYNRKIFFWNFLILFLLLSYIIVKYAVPAIIKFGRGNGWSVWKVTCIDVIIRFLKCFSRWISWNISEWVNHTTPFLYGVTFYYVTFKWDTAFHLYVVNLFCFVRFWFARKFEDVLRIHNSWLRSYQIYKLWGNG